MSAFWVMCKNGHKSTTPPLAWHLYSFNHYVVPFLPLQCRLSQYMDQNCTQALRSRKDMSRLGAHVYVSWKDILAMLVSCLSPDGQQLVSGSYDSTVRLWNMSTGAILQVMTGHTSSVHLLTYSPNGMHIASSSGDDRTVRIWDATTGLQVNVYLSPKASLPCHILRGWSTHSIRRWCRGSPYLVINATHGSVKCLKHVQL